ncbi:unnamed protein product [Paramecium pentaurelia]|uniref:Uncharacterized protein n=1 Tax=Paramecium pentaurelia TaxID=43138 RepID=A0A8S1V8G3_9CILI|nr:unnamed protein product [Paramecium pentaurelia]
MTLLLLFFLLEYSNFAPLPAADADAKCSQNDLFILSKASIIRENYKDVTSQFNGALLSSARKTIFRTQGIDNLPLRNLLYYYPSDPNLPQGHVVANLGESIIVEFYQAYKINTVRFWMWDIDGRQTDMQVFAIAADRKTENVIYDGIAPPNVNVVKFLINWYQDSNFIIEEGIVYSINICRSSKYRLSMLFDQLYSFKRQQFSNILQISIFMLIIFNNQQILTKSILRIQSFELRLSYHFIQQKISKINFIIYYLISFIQKLQHNIL